MSAAPLLFALRAKCLTKSAGVATASPCLTCRHRSRRTPESPGSRPWRNPGAPRLSTPLVSPPARAGLFPPDIAGPSPPFQGANAPSVHHGSGGTLRPARKRTTPCRCLQWATPRNSGDRPAGSLRAGRTVRLPDVQAGGRYTSAATRAMDLATIPVVTLLFAPCNAELRAPAWRPPVPRGTAP